MGRAAPVAAAAGVFAALVVALGASYLGRDRDYPAQVVQPTPLFRTDVVPLRPGSEACFGDAVIEPHAREARFRVGTLLRPGAPLELRIAGRGYRHRARIAGGFADNALLEVPVRPPARATPVRVCIANRGERRMDLYGAADRTRGRTRAYVDGKLVRPNVAFGFWEAERRSIWERLPQTAERITAFRPGWVATGLVWALAALFVAGVPALVLWGLARSLR